MDMKWIFSLLICGYVRIFAPTNIVRYFLKYSKIYKNADSIA
jgi:hypothetical protein